MTDVPSKLSPLLSRTLDDYHADLDILGSLYLPIIPRNLNRHSYLLLIPL